MECSFLYSPLQNGAWIEPLQSQSGMLNNSGSHLSSATALQSNVGQNLNQLFWRPSRRRRSTFGLVCLPHHKSILKLSFFDDFRIYYRALTPALTPVKNFSNRKLAASKESYSCPKIGHSHAFYTHTPRRSLFALFSENLARIGEFGCFFFRKKDPR